MMLSDHFSAFLIYIHICILLFMYEFLNRCVCIYIYMYIFTYLCHDWHGRLQALLLSLQLLFLLSSLLVLISTEELSKP